MSPAVEEDPSLWQQVEAFRELLHEGAQLLGEVLVLTRNADESLNMLQKERARLDQECEVLRQEREKACREVEFAFEQLQAQEKELTQLREAVARSQTEKSEVSQNEHTSSRSLQNALKEAEGRARELEEELKKAKAPALIHAIDHVEEDTCEDLTRLKNLEHELKQTRLILAGERLRRNRAISLIRPSQGKDAGS